MAEIFTYNVHVGKNVVAMKPYKNTKAPRLRLTQLEDGLLEAQTEPVDWEEVFVYVFCGALSGLLSWMSFQWDQVPRWAAITLTVLFGIAALFLIIYGLGRISARKGLMVGTTRADLWSRFFWITRRKTVKGRPNYIICTATRDVRERGRYVFDICLHFPPPHGLLTVACKDGYAQVEQAKAARCKPYEIVLHDIHSDALDIAAKLGIKLRPNFTAGPILDTLKDFFKDPELTEPLDIDEDEEEEYNVFEDGTDEEE